MKTYRCRIALRLSDNERQQLERLIQERKYKNISQAVRAGLRELFTKQEANAID